MDGRSPDRGRSVAVAALRKAFEAHFHTPDDVQGYVRSALRIVLDADVPTGLQEAAFVQAVTLLAQKQVTFEQVTPTGLALPQNGQF